MYRLVQYTDFHSLVSCLIHSTNTSNKVGALAYAALIAARHFHSFSSKKRTAISIQCKTIVNLTPLLCGTPPRSLYVTIRLISYLLAC